ncbi:MAG TPA: histidine phosphatase family protein [Dehalococcoidia bacterium]|nr:histidine phosphatase family protein [Dehalococcoidia bacterium]
MQVILVRHGETASNRDRLALGRKDVPLNSLGLAQAARLGKAIALERAAGTTFAAVYSSPLVRARQTAEAIATALGLEVTEAPELIEMDVGEMDGLTGAELRERHPEFLRSWWGPEAGIVRMPGGESLQEVQDRAWPLIELVRDTYPAEAAVIAVSHNFVIRALICRALGIDLADFRRFEVGLASTTRLEFRGPRTLITNLNDVCHLAGLETEPEYWPRK